MTCADLRKHQLHAVTFAEKSTAYLRNGSKSWAIGKVSRNLLNDVNSIPITLDDCKVIHFQTIASLSKLTLCVELFGSSDKIPTGSASLGHSWKSGLYRLLVHHKVDQPVYLDIK